MVDGRQRNWLAIPILDFEPHPRAQIFFYGMELGVLEGMGDFQEKSSHLLRIFVYGTLKPGEANYQKYCAGMLYATSAIALGKLFALPMGFPAMTLGDKPVHGYLLCFINPEILMTLDELEDYQPARDASENLYYRQMIEIYDQEGRSLGSAWVYLMTKESVCQLGGVVLTDGCWNRFA